MAHPTPTLLYVTDLYYEAAGRPYHEEDLLLTRDLSAAFDLVLCHPTAAAAFVGRTDGIVFRNAGPVLLYEDAYAAFRQRCLATRARVYNTLTGKADMCGKQYLVDLSRRGFPVIPTIDDRADLARLPAADRYVVKPKLGADSIGLEVVDADQLERLTLGDRILQPRIDFVHEVSFYFVDRCFQYALFAPDPAERWRLLRFVPDDADLAFAQQFVDWNDIDHGIQRVDACRTTDGSLLLMELEDINPYLSLDLLDDATRNAFVGTLTAALRDFLD